MPSRASSVLLLAVALATAACGSSSPSPTASSPSPTAAVSEDPDATRVGSEDPSSDGHDGTAPGPDGSAADPGDASPRPTAPPGVIFPPQGERYVYTVSGERRTPSMSSVAAYPSGTQWVWDFDRVVPQPGGEGVEFHYTATLEADDSETEVHWLYRRAGLRLGYTSVKLPGTAYACKYQPPIELVNVPLEPETYPEQSWSGTGCSGTTQIEVVAERTTTDAAGRRHRTWEIREHTTYRVQLTEGTLEATHFYSPDLGVDVRLERDESGTASTKAYRYDQVFVLAEETR